MSGNKRTLKLLLTAVLLSFFCFLLDLEPSTWKHIVGRSNMGRQEVTYTLYMMRSFGLYHKLFMLWAALPYGRRFIEEYQSRGWYFYLHRTGSIRYACERVLISAFYGGITSCGGMFLMLMLLYIKGFPFYTQNNPVIYSGCAYVELLYKNEFVLYALVYLVLYFLAGMLLAGIGAAVSAFASNKYVVLAAPYMVYRIYMEFAKGMKIPDIFRLDFIFSGRVQPLGTATSLVLAAAITIALLTVCTVIFAAGVKRRLENVR